MLPGMMKANDVVRPESRPGTATERSPVEGRYGGTTIHGNYEHYSLLSHW